MNRYIIDDIEMIDQDNIKIRGFIGSTKIVVRSWGLWILHYAC